MRNPVFRMRREECFQVADITGQSQGVIAERNREDSAAEGQDFIVISTPCGLMNQKIELHALTIKVPVNAHEEGFNAAPIHASDRMENTSDALPRQTIYLTVTTGMHYHTKS